MSMFNNRNLPLNRIQKLQQRASRKQNAIVHDNAQDKALVTAYKNGDEEAGLQLLESYIDLVSYIYRYPQKAQYKTGAKLNIDWTPADKEDLIQEICLHFFALVNEYDAHLGDFQAIVKGKLHLRVYNNFFEDAVTTKFNEIEFDESIDFEAKANSILLDEGMTESLPSQHLELYQALNQLTAQQRDIVTMSIVKGWNSKEISQETGLAHATVRQNLKRGLDKLKTIMIPEEEKV